MPNEIESTTIAGTRVNSNVQGAQNAFAGFKIDSSDFLDSIEGRTLCDKCHRSRKFFCYKCYLPMPPLEGRIPSVELPIHIDIVKHPQEIDGKSTATHGPILAPNSISMCTYPDLPDSSRSILVFPSDDAEEAEVFMERVKKENSGTFPYDRIIFVDSTWNQTYRIVHDERIADLPKIKLSGIESLFWRYQRGNPTTYLATIEAVYHVCRIYHGVFISEPYRGEYDNLLFFFYYMFHKIRKLYDPKSLRAYATRPHLRE
ncbi:unnamed protein product [Allacma fusca]|uniref:tRNA-uridine aminocarboxypropyltransferase 1 n=1 Tax=Allacma fusca TaxID=39272 RepID=A0A8J2PCQ4_9HEXA|nr:unnamed protein product [Allacma fusca]